MRQLNRRDFLRTCGATAAAAPLLQYCEAPVEEGEVAEGFGGELVAGGE